MARVRHQLHTLATEITLLIESTDFSKSVFINKRWYHGAVVVGVSTMDLAGQRWAPGSPGPVGVVLAHQGVRHLTEGLITLHILKGDPGINVKQK